MGRESSLRRERAEQSRSRPKTPTVLDRRVNSVVRATLIKGNERLLTPEIVAEFNSLPGHFGEMLMRHERICFRVYGENLIVPMLLRTFSVRGVRELIEQGAVAFSLNDQMVNYLQSDVPGINPIVPGKLTSKTHADPEESVEMGLRFMPDAPIGPARYELRRILRDAYVQPSKDYAHHVATLACDAYEKGRFVNLGLPRIRELVKLELPERERLGKLAGELHDLALTADMEMETIDEFELATISDDSLRKLMAANKLSGAEARIFEIENVPTISKLISVGALSPAAIPTLREKPDARKFREWLRTIGANGDAREVSVAYIDSIVGEKRFLETKAGRFAKTLVVSGLSSVAGASLGGPVGLVVGGLIGSYASTWVDPIADQLVDSGLALFDEFVLGKLSKGWNPRHYFDSIVRPATKGE
jgi:hypothetical protein